MALAGPGCCQKNIRSTLTSWKKRSPTKQKPREKFLSKSRTDVSSGHEHNNRAVVIYHAVGCSNDKHYQLSSFQGSSAVEISIFVIDPLAPKEGA